MNSFAKIWENQSREAKQRSLDFVRRVGGFSLLENSKSPLPVFVHHETKTEWILVPRGNVRIGLSKKEESAARLIENPPPLNLEEMRPCHEVTVGRALVMRYPINRKFAEHFTNIDRNVVRPEFGRNRISDWIYLRREEAERIEQATGWSLPTEYQWEYICRAGTETLFFFGNELPHDAQLAPLVSHYIDDAKPNPAGIYGLFLGEWCRDHFRPTYQSSPTDDWVVRGGGSAFWPWQGSEWVFCISAIRIPSEDLSNGLAGARFVIELE